MLEIRSLTAGYGSSAPEGSGLVLTGLDLTVPPAAVTCVMGRNGAGKSTLMKTVMGLVRARSGEILLDGQRIDPLPAHRVAAQGIGYVPQGRRLFGDLTVAENLEIGLMVRNSGAKVRRRVLDLFPRLGERLGQVSRTLSGGEQQMLAIARALCVEPRVLLLDEPTEGLQPSMVTLIRDVLLQLRAEGVAVVLVEQRVEAVLGMADQVAFMVHGKVVETREVASLRDGAGAADPVFLRHVGV